MQNWQTKNAWSTILALDTKGMFAQKWGFATILKFIVPTFKKVTEYLFLDWC